VETDAEGGPQMFGAASAGAAGPATQGLPVGAILRSGDLVGADVIPGREGNASGLAAFGRSHALDNMTQKPDADSAFSDERRSE
jgi:hypothetical protein